ncbi:hypothetical protein LF1_11070 [Rubripirellula obstinata]|uniref:Uncharacterized protein n=1 Tax=Rubripirellula obstinata TaxID=406547 RepID=A0A5B1CFA7_9BACT|nr:hypothetical protein LF1_11070 [Rubripirellula obstinata]
MKAIYRGGGYLAIGAVLLVACLYAYRFLAATPEIPMDWTFPSLNRIQVAMLIPVAWFVGFASCNPKHILQNGW